MNKQTGLPLSAFSGGTHGPGQRAQENPLEVEQPLLLPLLPEVANVDTWRLVRVEPHLLHAISSRLLPITSFSKLAPQLSHLYSYNGIFSLLKTNANINTTFCVVNS